ncbi:MAG: M48 family metalloprotease [Acidobacteria bacterium]|nr:M48 family metalloprotease [Acidobacteriota bacterium]
MTKTPFVPSRLALMLAVVVVVPGLAVTPAVPQLPNPGSVSMSREDQERLGLKAMGEVYKQMPVLPDSSPITQYVQQLGRKLVTQIPQQYSWPYQFHVIEQKEINAFALPGGPIFVNIGTITAAQDEAQLAGVMSHEMSHVYMQHSAKAATSTKRTITEVLGAAAGALGGRVVGGLGQLLAGGLILRYSRTDESQADAVGAIIMYKAGYDPIELANFFETLSKQGGNPPQFLSDHPNPGNRTAAIDKEVKKWPAKSFSHDSESFQMARRQAVTIKAYGAQEIADGAKRGIWARQNMQAGAVPASVQQDVTSTAEEPTLENVSLEEIRPSNQFTELHQDGFSISYPANWSTASGQNSLTIAPRAGVSRNAVAYGVIVSAAQDPAAGSLDQVAQDLIQNLEQLNPGLHQNGPIRSIDVNGTSGRSIGLLSNSPIQQNGKPLPERDWLVLVPGSGGTFLDLILIAPERDFSALEPTYRKMIDSLRLQ